MKHKLLAEIGACQEAREWASQFATLQEAWDNCERGDWMLWLCGKFSGPLGSPSRRKLAGAAAKCAKLAHEYVRECDRPVVSACYAACDEYADGKGSLEDLRKAAANVACTANAAAAYAAAAVAYAANPAGNAASAAYAAANAARAAAYNADADAKKTLAKCADTVRAIYATVPERKARGK